MGDRGSKSKKRPKRHLGGVARGGSPEKRIVKSPEDSSAYEKPFRFRFNRVDVEGDWCLSGIEAGDHKELIRFMGEIETMKVKEVIPSRCKREDVAGSSVNQDAKKRAQTVFRDDHDRIHVLHVSGRKRLWGLQFENEFSVIWWDPNHEIWPTKRVRDN